MPHMKSVKNTADIRNNKSENTSKNGNMTKTIKIGLVKYSRTSKLLEKIVDTTAMMYIV